MLEYRRFLQDVKNLEFIRNQETADSAVKAIIGMLASSVEDGHARELTKSLPEPLTYERLRSRQAREIAPNLGQFIGQIRTRLRLGQDEARKLIDTVFHTTKEVVGMNVISDIEGDLPKDVAEEMERC